jgi:hypothetical protein
MMLIATGLAAALFAAASFIPDAAELPAGSKSSPFLPVVVNVVVGPGVPPALVSRLLEETSSIWHAGGVEFVWQRAAEPSVLPTRPTETGPYSASALRVVIGHYPGVSRDRHKMPLGWIAFDGEHEPQREIYLSYVNAQSLMESAGPVVGAIERLLPLQRDLLLARALGRALAHELGHYLLASRVHTAWGVLKGNRTASELFSIGRPGFGIDAAQRRQIAARMRGESLVVSR